MRGIMKLEDFKGNTDTLIEELSERTKSECIRLFQSGAVDTSEYACDFILPRIILTVALENIASGYAPLHPDHKREILNLRHF